jgi:hypothetical protein
MATSHAYSQQATIDAISGLAEEIARANPDCADKAMQIIRLLGDIDAKPEAATIEDAIDAQSVGDMSDTTVRNATNAVVRTMRDEP